MMRCIILAVLIRITLVVLVLSLSIPVYAYNFKKSCAAEVAKIIPSVTDVVSDLIQNEQSALWATLIQLRVKIDSSPKWYLGAISQLEQLLKDRNTFVNAESRGQVLAVSLALFDEFESVPAKEATETLKQFTRFIYLLPEGEPNFEFFVNVVCAEKLSDDPEYLNLLISAEHYYSKSTRNSERAEKLRALIRDSQ